MELIRCDWANRSQAEQCYHDTQWGRPIHDDRVLFKLLILEGQQAGLSWATILAKMDTLCAAFDDFDPERLTGYGQEKIESLLLDEGIIRNRQKVNAAVHNAKMYLELRGKYGSLDTFLWRYIDHTPILNRWETIGEVPASTALSDEISAQLKREGFKFVGSTTIYAFMQSIGMVNDHLLSCSFRSPHEGETP